MNGSSTVSNALHGAQPTPSKALSASRCCSCVGTLTGYTVSQPSTRTINRKINGKERIEQTRKIEGQWRQQFDRWSMEKMQGTRTNVRNIRGRDVFVAKEFWICIRMTWNESDLGRCTSKGQLLSWQRLRKDKHTASHSCRLTRMSVCIHVCMYVWMHAKNHRDPLKQWMLF